MYSVYDTLAGGLPHSDIHGSTPARGSPWLFAACHVLHRLLVPRHPPNALLMLESNGSPHQVTPTRQPNPMHRNHPRITNPENDPVMDHLTQHTYVVPEPWRSREPDPCSRTDPAIRSDMRPRAPRDAPKPDSP